MKQVDHHEGDEAQAIELGEVDALAGLGRSRRRGQIGTRLVSGRVRSFVGSIVRRCCRPRQHAIDEPLGQVVAWLERFGLMTRAHQVDRVPSLAQGLEVVGDSEVRPIVAASGSRRDGSARRGWHATTA